MHMQIILQYHVILKKNKNSDQRLKISCGLNMIEFFLYTLIKIYVFFLQFNYRKTASSEFQTHAFKIYIVHHIGTKL